ncbi:tetratricopeptide repeat protein [Endozoicomonas euniceicola]|uniref:Tetratricopeptide repeat protein n=1 Tax=Endozoicomonas euniceicola TaxID=1234143 RepID=A0ABY6GRE4_9GAMM|nr:hypothetical protein [Endozoicomonas euniceicola]UYM15322.1 hypothetical protein NX720_21090 [Endozoicomonas euniceicola]
MNIKPPHQAFSANPKTTDISPQGRGRGRGRGRGGSLTGTVQEAVGKITPPPCHSPESDMTCASASARRVTPTGTDKLNPSADSVHREVRRRLDNGYKFIKQQKWNEAVKEFKAIKGANPQQEIQKISGHARALNKLGQFKAALNLLDQLPDSDDKSIDNRSIMVSKATAFEGLKRYEEAEVQLLALFEQEGGINKRDIKPCNKHDTNLALVRLWELMGKYDKAEALLLATFSQESGDYEKGIPCNNHYTNLALARFLQITRRYDEAEALLLATFSQESGDYRKGILCKYHDTNLALARLLQITRRYDEAEVLLLATFSQESGDYDKGIPCKNHDTNLALARLWELMGRYDEAEALLLATFRQESGDLKKGKPCNNHQTNLALVYLWELMDKYDEAEALLLATFRQESGDLKKGKPCNNHDTNLALVRLWELMDRPDEAKALLLATFRQESGDLKKGKPCNNHDTNLVLAYNWAREGKLVRARNLITKDLDTKFLTKDQKNSCKLALAISYTGTEEFNAHIENVTLSVDKEHAQSIHNLCFFMKWGLGESQKEGGSPYLKEALTHVENALSCIVSNEKKAQLLSQKAHVIRFLEPGKKQWKELFEEAARLDPSRNLKDKMEPWRQNENKLLTKLGIK